MSETTDHFREAVALARGMRTGSQRQLANYLDIQTAVQIVQLERLDRIRDLLSEIAERLEVTDVR